MKRTYKLLSIIIASLMALTLIATITFAQTAGDKQAGPQFQARNFRQRGAARFRRQRVARLIFKRLNLTDEQKAQAKQVRQSHRESLMALRKEMRTRRLEIRKSLQGGAFDEALVREKLTEIAGLRAKVMAERFQMRQQMLALLTPEQKATLNQLRQEIKARRAAARSASGV